RHVGECRQDRDRGAGLLDYNGVWHRRDSSFYLAPPCRCSARCSNHHRRSARALVRGDDSDLASNLGRAVATIAWAQRRGRYSTSCNAISSSYGSQRQLTNAAPDKGAIECLRLRRKLYVIPLQVSSG